LDSLLLPVAVVHLAVAAVWLYEGLWCKLLRGQPHEFEVVRAVPRWGPRWGEPFLYALGVIEVLIAIWVLSRIAPVWCAAAQTLLLVALNAAGIFWSRYPLPDPVGMVLKNAALLVLAWVSASLPGWW
jgi:hypothetical protein